MVSSYFKADDVSLPLDDEMQKDLFDRTCIVFVVVFLACTSFV